MKEVNEVMKGVGGSGPVTIRPLGTNMRDVAPVPIRGHEGAGLLQSDGGFNFAGVDSLGGTVKGFVQTEDPVLAANELQRAGISVGSDGSR
jgi:hypothetical protein